MTLQDVLDSGQKLTPMIQQYAEVKQQHPDNLLLFRMGDFYELFFEDAVEASQILNITLTQRGKIGDLAIPMAGIPHHAASNYIDRITQVGRKAVICEQVEDPKEAQGIVKRAVTQIASPSLPYDLEKSAAGQNYFIASAFEDNQCFFLSLLDFTTGNVQGMEFADFKEFLDCLKLHAPKEFIAYLGQWDHHPILEKFLKSQGCLTTLLSQEYFGEHADLIEKIIPAYQTDQTLKTVTPLLPAIAALSYYVHSTQPIEKLWHLKPFKLQSCQDFMRVTHATLTGLEILPRSAETLRTSLLGFLNKTKTAAGSRQLATFLQTPLTDLQQLHERQELIEFFTNHPDVLAEARQLLGQCRDLERILAKVSTQKVSAQDLLAIANTITSFLNVRTLLTQKKPEIFTKLLVFDAAALQQLTDVTVKIAEMINPELGASLDKGNLICEGFDLDRDKLYTFTTSVGSKLLKLEKKYRTTFSITTLKIKSNNIAGHFIEVPRSQSSKVPEHFTRKQTLVNTERYLSQELIDLERELIVAKEKLYKKDQELFTEILSLIQLRVKLLGTLSSHIAITDIFQSLGFIAHQQGFTRPVFSAEKKIQLKGMWHPLIKAQIGEEFINHSLHLTTENYFGLITGPNMAGKTTVMREVAIIQFLAQIGSFVPAEFAEISLCDYLFSRLGASDDIVRGHSTFMVEMTEAAEIIRHATPNSLIILDEIGRGTSTYDGLSIAWSLSEYFINELKAFTLFATHYHELIQVIDELPGAKNFTVETVEQGDDILFLYRLIERGATQSFGINVAKLAGLPKSLIRRSQELLSGLEKKSSAPSCSQRKQQLSFLSPAPVALEQELQNLDINNLTPLQALQKLHEWKNR